MEYRSWSPPNQLEADRQTIAGLRAGDDGTIRRVLADVHGMAMGWVGVSVEQADEIAAITIGRALPQLDEFRGESSVRSWLRGIAWHVWADMLRLAAREPLDPVALEKATAWDDDWEDDLLMHMDLAQALGKLAEDEQRVLTLRYRDRLSVAETARAMGRSEDGVKSLVWRAKRKLEVLLEGWRQ